MFKDFCVVGIIVSIMKFFVSPSSIAAFTKACRFSKFVKLEATLPVVAYFSAAGSILTKIPSSSNSSGSSFAAPRTTRLKASVKVSS